MNIAFLLSDERGYLIKGGEPMSVNYLAKACNVSRFQIQSSVKKLQELSSLKYDNRGVLFLPRMVQDIEKQQDAMDSGKRGGNPALR